MVSFFEPFSLGEKEILNSHFALDLISDKYKTNPDYYSETIFPSRSEEPMLFKNDPKLKNLIKVLFNKEISTLLSDDLILKKFPKKTYFIIYECDQFKDDGLIYAKRLESAGIDVKVSSFY